MNRADFWYIFGLAALTLLALRVRSTRPAALRDPMALAFTLCLFLPAFGTLSKQPRLAYWLDAWFGPNAAWLVADSLFIAGVCAGTYWIDFLGDPAQKAAGRRLLTRWRLAALGGVIAWMVATAHWDALTWATVERGGLDVGGQVGLLSGRLAYFGYSLWGLVYLSRGFYRQRQRLRDRVIYIRMTLAWTAVTLAIAAPLIQIIGTGVGFIHPDLLPLIWPPLWKLLSLTQVGVAVFILATFLTPAYRLVIWLDKQFLIYRLLWLRRRIKRTRPDLLEPTPPLGRPGLLTHQVDLWLATLVNEVEFVKTIISPTVTAAVIAPAGGAMPKTLKQTRQIEQVQFKRGLAHERVKTYQVTGNFYSLARWYVEL